MNRPVKSIIFDFDYTLADSSQGVIECVNFALAGLGFPIVSAEQICRTIGLHLTTTYQTLTGDFQPHRTEEFIRLFAQRADQVMATQTVLFETIERKRTKTGNRVNQISLSDCLDLSA